MTAEEYLKSKHHMDDIHSPTAYIARMMEEYASIKVAEGTKDMYPKAFVEWRDVWTDYNPYGNTYYVRSIDRHFVGLKLLFEYWEQNIRK